MTPLERACAARWSLGRFLHQGRPADTDAMTAQELACQAAEEIADACNYLEAMSAAPGLQDTDSVRIPEALRLLRLAAVQVGHDAFLITAARAEEQLAELREMRGVPDWYDELFDAAGRAKVDADRRNA